MTTAILQMAALLVCAFAFAGYLLRLDKKDRTDKRQERFEFPAGDEEHERRGVAMSRLK
jgi:hypothetical protein